MTTNPKLKIQTGSETVNPTKNVTNDEVSPSTSDVVSSLEHFTNFLSHSVREQVMQKLLAIILGYILFCRSAICFSHFSYFSSQCYHVQVVS